jgi:hypothetical protein
MIGNKKTKTVKMEQKDLNRLVEVMAFINDDLVIKEEKKKKADRCLKIARRKYDKPSAYRSGAIVRCRQGKIWKGLSESDVNDAPEDVKSLIYKIPIILSKVDAYTGIRE